MLMSIASTAARIAIWPDVAPESRNATSRRSRLAAASLVALATNTATGAMAPMTATTTIRVTTQSSVGGLPSVSNAVTARDPAAASVSAGSPLIATSSFGACRPFLADRAGDRAESVGQLVRRPFGHQVREGRRHERLTGGGQSRQAGRDRGPAAESGDVDPGERSAPDVVVRQ